MQLIVGNKTFKSKKEALLFYKTILNSYDFGATLDAEDFLSLLELIKTRKRYKDMHNLGIRRIQIGKAKFNNKCFEIVRYNDSTELFS